MAKDKSTYDVYISYSRQDKKLSLEIGRILQSHGLQVFTDSEMMAGRHIEETLWEAMAECQALVVVIPEIGPSAWIAFELGAAKAWNKPIYPIAANPASASIPVGLQGIVIYPPSRADEIAEEIKASAKSLTVTEEKLLVEVYHGIGVPVDQLLLRPKQLVMLTKQFERVAKRHVASEELLRNLLRLRKRGALGPSNVKNARKVT